MEPKVVHCKKEPFDVYIGRPSKWGNPYSHLDSTVLAGKHAKFKVETQEEAIQKFEEWIQTQPELLEAAKKELRGKILGCWCSPKSCHGDVLLKIVNQ
jgi:hypothetical protein